MRRLTGGLIATVFILGGALAFQPFALAQKGGSHSSSSHSSSTHSTSTHSSSTSSKTSGTKTSAHSSSTHSTTTHPSSTASKTSGTHTSTHSSSSSVSGQTSTTHHSANYCATCARDKNGKILRGEEAKDAFKKQTGYPKGRPGYVIDHIVPLACGGADAPSNMQWQTAAAAKAKDKTERKGCTK